MTQHKLFRLTTIPLSLSVLLKGQLAYLNQYYHVMAIASDKDQKDWEVIAEREGVACKPIRMERDISLWNDVVALIRLYSLFVKERPHIIHANTPKASLLGMIAGKLARVPHRIYTVTGLRFEAEQGKKRVLLVAMERLTCWAATKVIPEGDGVKQTLLRNRITDKPLVKIANGNINGIDTTFFSREAILPEEREHKKYILDITAEDTVFCFVGRLVGDKGINELVHAFVKLNQAYPATKLLLVGPLEEELDPLDAETKRYIDYHTAIITTGFCADIRPYLAISDIFVFPSYREGFPNVVMQAGAMDLPCIVTDINGCNEIIIQDVNGLIIPPKDETVLSEAMMVLLSDCELRSRLARTSRKMISERYEQSLVWKELLKMYHSLN